MVSSIRTLLICFFSLIGILSLGASTRVFVLPLEDEIDATAWQHTRRACDEAMQGGAQIFVVRMNTYGGALDAADSIRTALSRLPMPTVAFVNHNAASAGALIALACDSVFMAPGASMGAATVVDGAGQPMPDKYQAYMSSIMRSTAQQHGKVMDDTDSVMRWRRDPAVAAAMVNPDKVVSFSASEAVEAGYADGVAASLSEALLQLGIDNPQVEVFSPTLTDDIIGFLSNAAVRAMLVMLIIGGIYMEMHTPGLGVAAAVAFVATCLYFLPMFICGTLPAWIVILLVIGIILIALEIFVIPGFGFCGIAGISAVLVALCASIVPVAPQGQDLSLSDVAKPLLIVCIGVVAAVAAVVWLTSRHGPEFIRRRSELMLTQDVKDGYIGVDMSLAAFVGHQGTAMTDLRPSGKIVLDGKVYDAVSTGTFINASSHIRVVRYENAQLYVEQAEIV